MKILISYFYQIRFFKPNMIPLSTACWDPLWYHNFTRDYNYVFKDKRNVYNGLRADPLHIPYEVEHECGTDLCSKEPDKCIFMQKYKQYIYSLNFQDIYKRCKRIGNYIKNIEKFKEEPIIVLIVYETPTNPCSERIILKQWFKDNNYELEEFNKEMAS